MAVSHEDWEVLLSRICLAKNDIASDIVYPSGPGHLPLETFCVYHGSFPTNQRYVVNRTKMS